MNLLELKEIVDKEIEKGNGDAIIEVQALADGIGDIIISGYEGCGYELGGDVKAFSLISDIEKKEMIVIDIPITMFKTRHEYWEKDKYNLPEGDKNRKPYYVCYTYTNTFSF